ncbi:MAG: zinc-finger domain-containing protein [Hyphomonadaceae bacterium]
MGSTAKTPASTTPTDAAAWYRDHPEVIVVSTKKVSCDGGGGALGHPKVWYDMSEQDYAECKYCDRVFALKGGSRDPGK